MQRICLVFTLLFSVSLFAQTNLSEREVRSLLGDFPAEGTALEKRDDDILMNYQHTRTQQDCDKAASQESVDFRNFFQAPAGPLTAQEVKALEKKMEDAGKQASQSSRFAKNLYQRPRPYQRNSAIHPCIRMESSYSYPSGHTTISRVWARLLSRIHPERAADFLRISDAVAENRVIGGVHHPSDIEAGKKLGDAIAEKMP